MDLFLADIETRQKRDDISPELSNTLTTLRSVQTSLVNRFGITPYQTLLENTDYRTNRSFGFVRIIVQVPPNKSSANKKFILRGLFVRIHSILNHGYATRGSLTESGYEVAIDNDDFDRVKSKFGSNANCFRCRPMDLMFDPLTRRLLYHYIINVLNMDSFRQQMISAKTGAR